MTDDNDDPRVDFRVWYNPNKILGFPRSYRANRVVTGYNPSSSSTSRFITKGGNVCNDDSVTLPPPLSHHPSLLTFFHHASQRRVTRSNTTIREPLLGCNDVDSKAHKISERMIHTLSNDDNDNFLFLIQSSQKMTTMTAGVYIDDLARCKTVWRGSCILLTTSDWLTDWLTTTTTTTLL